MKTTLKILSIFLAVTAVCLMAGSPVLAVTKVIKLHHLNKDDPFDNPTGAMATVFKSLVEAGTNGGIQVQTFPNGQLGKDAEVVQQVKSGVIQAGIHSVGGFASVYPMMGVIDIPFAFPNISATYEVFDGPFGQKLAADIEKKTGLHVVGFGDSGGFFISPTPSGPSNPPKIWRGSRFEPWASTPTRPSSMPWGASPQPSPGPRSTPPFRPGWPTAR